jgi:hypothetical protein
MPLWHFGHGTGSVGLSDILQTNLLPRNEYLVAQKPASMPGLALEARVEEVNYTTKSISYPEISCYGIAGAAHLFYEPSLCRGRFFKT